MVEGTHIGAYRVQQIGEGGMGSVWRAEHIALGRRAALKVLHPRFSRSPGLGGVHVGGEDHRFPTAAIASTDHDGEAR
jgi:serine/threonine protein kinase